MRCPDAPTLAQLRELAWRLWPAAGLALTRWRHEEHGGWCCGAYRDLDETRKIEIFTRGLTRRQALAAMEGALRGLLDARPGTAQ